MQYHKTPSKTRASYARVLRLRHCDARSRATASTHNQRCGDLDETNTTLENHVIPD